MKDPDEYYKLAILKSLAINYPVLREWNCHLNKLLLVVVEDGQLKTMTDLLSNSAVPRLNNMMKLRDIMKVFENAFSTFVAYPCVGTGVQVNLLHDLITTAKLGSIAGTQIYALPVVISEGLPIKYDLQNFFTVFMQGDFSDMYFEDYCVVPGDDQLMLIKEKIRLLTARVKVPEERALVAATCFLYPQMVKAGKEMEFEKMVDCARKLVKLDDDNRDTSNLSEAFLVTLYRWQEKTDFHQIYPLPNLSMSVQAKIDEVVLYDQKFLYCREKLFKEIVEPLLRIISEPVLKEALVDADILYSEKGGTYTVKVGYYNVAGGYGRERMLKFRRDKLNLAGEMSFVELCRKGAEDICEQEND